MPNFGGLATTGGLHAIRGFSCGSTVFLSCDTWPHLVEFPIYFKKPSKLEYACIHPIFPHSDGIGYFSLWLRLACCVFLSSPMKENGRLYFKINLSSLVKKDLIDGDRIKFCAFAVSSSRSKL
jgi:hypothetical protein